MNKFLIILLLLSNQLLGQKADSLTQIIKKNEKSIIELTQKVDKFQETIDRQSNITDKTFNGISNQLSSSSNSLTLFGILFGILAIALGIYVTYIERKIVKISERNVELLNQTLTVKAEVVEINRQIQSDIQGLFKKIKREETNHILDRLMKVPKDVSNLLQELLSRELDRADFDKLKVGYQQLLPEDALYRQKYEMLFFQHFADLALKDLSIQENFIKYLPTGIECSFENDILKSTNEIFQFLIDTGLVNNKELINSYFTSLGKSKFKEYKPIYDLIFQKLSQREKQFLLAQLIDINLESEMPKIIYGDLLTQTIAGTETTESEKLILAELSTIKKQKQEREENAEKK